MKNTIQHHASKKKIKLTGAAGAWAEQSVGGHWWTSHSGWAPQALCCRWGVYSAAPPPAAHSSAHSASEAALWFAQHTGCPASKRWISFTWYINCLHKKTLSVTLEGISYRPGASFPQQPLKHCTIAVESFSSPKAEGKQSLWSDGNKELQQQNSKLQKIKGRK